MIKKTLALVLAIVMLFSVASVSTFAAAADHTITTTITFTDDLDGENVIYEAKAGDTIYMWVDFAGNPTVLDDSIQGVNLLIEYGDKMEFAGLYEGLINPDVYNESFVPGVLYVTWAKMEGISVKVGRDKVVQESGNLFEVDMVVKEDLTEADLAAVKLIPNAVNGILKQHTFYCDSTTEEFNYVQEEVYKAAEAATPAPTKAPSSNADLKAIYVSGISEIEVAAGKLTYNASASDGYAKHVIWAHKANGYATVQTAVVDSEEEIATATYKDTHAASFDRLAYGDKKIVLFKVTSEDGTREYVYTVNITKPAKTDCTMKGIFLSGLDLPALENTEAIQEIEMLNHKYYVMQAQVPGSYNATVEFRYGADESVAFEDAQPVEEYANRAIKFFRGTEEAKPGRIYFIRVTAEDGKTTTTYRFKLV